MGIASAQRIEKVSGSASAASALKTCDLLWAGLKGRRFQRYKFRRQFSFGVFIIDFYSQRCKLAVEVVRDPRVLDRNDEYRRRRRQYIELYDIAIIQFTSAELCNNIDAVLGKIAEVAKRRSTGIPGPMERAYTTQDPAPIVIPLE